MNKDGSFSTPCGLAIYCHLLGRANGWIVRSDEREISRRVERAAYIGIDDPVALCWAGHAQAIFFGDVERALPLIDRALEIDVNLAIAWQHSGSVRTYAGDSAGAIASLAMTTQLNLLDPRVFLTHAALAFAHFIAGRDDDAAACAETALRLSPTGCRRCVYRLSRTPCGSGRILWLQRGIGI